MNKDIKLSNYCVANISVKETYEYFICAYEKEKKQVQTSKYFEVPVEFIKKMNLIKKGSEEEKNLINDIVLSIEATNEEFKLYDANSVELVKKVNKARPSISFDYSRNFKEELKYPAPILPFECLHRSNVYKEHTEYMNESKIKELIINICKSNMDVNNNFKYYCDMSHRCEGFYYGVTGKKVQTPEIEKVELLAILEEVSWNHSS